MTERDQFASPVMRARARLHSDEAGRQLFEESQKALPPNAPPQNGVPAGVDAVDLKDRLGEIETNGCNRHDLLPQLDVTTSPISDDDAEAVHAIKWQTQSRYMQVDAFARIDAVEQDPILSISTEAAWS